MMDLAYKMKLLKSSSIYLFSEIISKLLPFLLLPYFSRILGMDEFGRLSLYQAYYNFILIFIVFGMDATLLRAFHRYGKLASIRILLLCFCTVSFLFICFFLVALFFEDIIIMSVVTAYLLSLNSIILVYFQSQGKAISYVKYQLSNIIGSTALTLLLFNMFSGNVEYRALSLCLVLVVVSSVFVFQFTKYNIFSKIRFNPKIYLRYMLNFGFGITVNKLSFFFRGQFDRIIVNGKLNLSDLAIYSLASQISLAFSIVLIAVNKAYAPYIYSRLKRKDISVKEINNQLFLSLLLPVIVFFSMYFFPPGIYIFVFGNDYAGLMHLVPQMSLAQSMQITYIIMSTIVIYFGEIKMLSIITLVSAMTHVISLLILGSSGIYIISWISCATGLMQIILVYFLLFRKLKFK